MKTIIGNGINYEVTGAREEEAAAMLVEGLDAVSKRRNAYVDDNIEVVLKSVREYGVDVSFQSVAREHLVARLDATLGAIRGIGEGGFWKRTGNEVAETEGTEGDLIQ